MSFHKPDVEKERLRKPRTPDFRLQTSFMKLIPVSAGHFPCDGGALFGAIPKVLWNKIYPCNNDNIPKLTLRCLLVETVAGKIIIQTGITNHTPEKHVL